MGCKKLGLWLIATVAAVIFSSASAYCDALRPSDPRQINRNFEAALQDIATARPQAAVARLHDILAQNPNLLRVRLELARALFLANDMSRARQEFLTVLSATGIPAAVTQNILRFIRAIDAHEGVTHTVLFALTTPSDVGRRYDTNVVYLDLFQTGVALPFTLVRKQAPRLAAKFEGSVRRLWRIGRVSNRVASAFYLRAHARMIAAPGGAFNDSQLDFAPGLQFGWPQTTLEIEMQTSAFYTGGTPSEDRAGLGITLQMHSASGLSFSADIAARHASNKIDTLYGGRLFKANFTLQQGTAGNGFYAAALTLDSRAANRADYSYSHAVLRLSRQINLKGGFSVNASLYGDIFLQDSATPGFAAARTGREYGFDVKVIKTDSPLLNRYAPFVSIGASRHDSSIRAYSFNDLRLQIGVQSVF